MTLIMTVGMIPMTSLAATHRNEWVQKSDGKWYYYDENGVKVKNESVQDPSDKKYYVLDTKGARVTAKGWYTAKYRYNETYEKSNFTTKYYIKSDGSCATGWKKIKGKYYFFDYVGEMRKNESAIKTVDGVDKRYLLGSDGTRITKKGWHQVTYKYLYYYGEVKSTKNKYYVKSDGTVATGIKKIKGKKYVFNHEGVLTKNSYASKYNADTQSYSYYMADKNGVLITKKGWHTYKYDYPSKGYAYNNSTKGTHKVYIGSGGKLVTGLREIDGKYYYLDPYARKNTKYTDPDTGITYFFGKSGACTKTYQTDA